jgi:hypothetical protein
VSRLVVGNFQDPLHVQRLSVYSVSKGVRKIGPFVFIQHLTRLITTIITKPLRITCLLMFSKTKSKFPMHSSWLIRVSTNTSCIDSVQPCVMQFSAFDIEANLRDIPFPLLHKLFPRHLRPFFSPTNSAIINRIIHNLGMRTNRRRQKRCSMPSFSRNGEWYR